MIMLRKAMKNAWQNTKLIKNVPNQYVLANKVDVKLVVRIQDGR